MAYSLLRQRRIAADLRGLPADICDRVGIQIAALANDPRPPGARNVLGIPQGYRIHVTSGYVVVYVVDDRARTVTIMRVGHRKDVYRGL